jgi:hypothetical protein
MRTNSYLKLKYNLRRIGISRYLYSDKRETKTTYKMRTNSYLKLNYDLRRIAISRYLYSDK